MTLGITTVTACVMLLPVGVSRAAETGRCGDPASRPWCDTSLSADQRAGLLLKALTRDEKISLLAGDDPLFASGHTGKSDGVARVGLPPTYYSDGPVGPRQGKATAMPAPMALAATFDPAAARRHGAVVGNEAKLKGNDVVFAPTVNLMRTPLGGRTFEAYGEDPYLVSRTGVGWIEGAQSEGVIGNVKHYAANNQEGMAGVVGGRLTVNAVVDERTLREMYLPAFEAAVTEADVGSVMCAYNRVNGQYACENQHLLNQVLKTEWGFDGYVLTDYGAAKSTANGLNNGLDFEPWPGLVYSPLPVNLALATSQASTADVDAHVRRILRTLFKYGFFDRPGYPNDDSLIDKAAHLATAGAIEEQAITLLKNDGVLPLDAGALDSIALIGDEADTYKGGGGSSAVDPFSVTTPRQGIEKRAGSGVRVSYDPGESPQAAADAARGADVAIVFASDNQTEFVDKPGLDLDDGQVSVLPPGAGNPTIDQDAVIEAVIEANPNTVVVLETGGPVLTPWRDAAPALLEAWYPGSDGGTAIARVLFGDADPGGRLPVTFPQREEDIPTAGDPEAYPGVAETATYKEGVFIGYRHYDERGIEPAYAFGHGLSYTSFDIHGLRIRPGRDSVATVEVSVTNTGARTGVAAPQLYLGLPDPGGDVTQPPRQLKGFQKLTLAPGETKRVSFSLDRRALAYWNAEADSWRVANGCYAVMLGSSSRAIHQRGTLAWNADCGARAVTVRG
ncbi:MAG: beta-glucosidase [Micromonosporaceae bacterium]